jgi:hypothetical protein
LSEIWQACEKSTYISHNSHGERNLVHLLRKTGGDVSTSGILGVHLHEFTITTSWIHDFYIQNSRIQDFKFVKIKSWIWKREVQNMNLWSWIHEIEIVNSWCWNREFMKLKSWIDEVEIVNSWSWNREFMKLKSCIHEVEIMNSWISYVENLNSRRWKREFMKCKCPHRFSIIVTYIWYWMQTPNIYVKFNV